MGSQSTCNVLAREDGVNSEVMNSGQSLFISREQLVEFTDGLNEGCLKREEWRGFFGQNNWVEGGAVYPNRQIGSWVEITSFTFWHIMFLILIRNLKWWSWVDINSWIYWSGAQEKVGSAGEKLEALLTYGVEVMELDKVIKEISVELLKRGASREEWRRPVISGNQVQWTASERSEESLWGRRV